MRDRKSPYKLDPADHEVHTGIGPVADPGDAGLSKIFHIAALEILDHGLDLFLLVGRQRVRPGGLQVGNHILQSSTDHRRALRRQRLARQSLVRADDA